MYAHWTPDTIRWYLNAERHTGFFRSLAGHIGPMLCGCETLCDIGCGLGLLDLALQPLLTHIDCVDLSETALASLAERAGAAGMDNLTPLLADSSTLTGRWDAVCLSFFGSREMERYLPLCRKLIAVVSMAPDLPLSPRQSPSRRGTAGDAAARLTALGIPFRMTAVELEFGQPFTSLSDAEQFVRVYTPGAPVAELQAFLSRNLTETGNPTFPYYLPRPKAVGIFELDGQSG